MKIKYLKHRCRTCKELMKASVHPDPKTRYKRNEEKVFCGPVCEEKYEQQKLAGNKAYLKFIYGVTQ